jgi:hypothetical protein
MNHKLSTLVAGCILVAGLAGLPGYAAADKITGHTTGQCKLKNVNVGKVLYKGDCTIKQTIKNNETIWSITMGDSEPFLFAGNGTKYMHGPEETTFHDKGNSGVFKWGDFRLDVEQD